VDQAIETIMTEPLERLSPAIEARDRSTFAESYDTLTEGCNACHQATDFGFNVVQRPRSSPFPNRVFAPERRLWPPHQMGERRCAATEGVPDGEPE
jgi:hypothetical protein